MTAVASPDWFGGDGAVVYADDYMLYALHTTPSFQNKVIWTYKSGIGPVGNIGSPVAIGDGAPAVLLCGWCLAPTASCHSAGFGSLAQMAPCSGARPTARLLA